LSEIRLLSNETVDRIAAGEVVERPASVVKELVENAIDAFASAITVEIKNGGASFIRVTDNGDGIPKDQIRSAFLRHATSKIITADDLSSLHTLGFRGEALSSICAVSQTEIISKTSNSLVGTRLIIHGGREELFEEIGAPNGTTILVRNLFYNIPVRRKFLKTISVESSAIYDLMEHLILSKPTIRFTFILNGKTKLHTSGNGNLLEIVYRIYGKEVVDELYNVSFDANGVSIAGFISSPFYIRKTRAFENIFINNRYIHSDLLMHAIENTYTPYLMQHNFPFALLFITCDPSTLDVNIHPTKMEVRFNNPTLIVNSIEVAIEAVLKNDSLIKETKIDTKEDKELQKVTSKQAQIIYQSKPEPFESNRQITESFEENVPYYEEIKENTKVHELLHNSTRNKVLEPFSEECTLKNDFFDAIRQKEETTYRILGQLFDTYWIIAYIDKLYIIDQHAAHEKVKYERLLLQMREEKIITQNIFPPIVITLTAKEVDLMSQFMDSFCALGFEIEIFGKNEYAIRAVPTELYGCNAKEFFQEILDELIEKPVKGDFLIIHKKIASMACKAAVKGNSFLTMEEMDALLQELLTLENPFFCPHGRPTIISMTKQELEKKFKRVL